MGRSEVVPAQFPQQLPEGVQLGLQVSLQLRKGRLLMLYRSIRIVTSLPFGSRAFNAYPQAGDPILLPGSGSKFRSASQVADHIR